jgi:hypothetical protein
MTRTAIGLGAALLLLAGCAEPPPPTPLPSPPPPPRAEAPPPAPTRDECGAFELQGLVGRPRAEIPVPVIPNLQRVACSTCPVTQDFNPRRLNFFYDAETGSIQKVTCG